MIIRKKKKQTTPAIGDYRVELRFAWWPKRTDDGLIWLERYKEIWEYTYRRRSWFIGARYYFETMCGGWDLRQRKRCPRNF